MSFINPSVLNKQMKIAYNANRLVLGMLRGSLVIKGLNFMVLIDAVYAPNKIKALITEFSGENPTKDKLLEFDKKAKSSRQLEPEEVKAIEYIIDKRTNDIPYEISMVSVMDRGTDIRLFQDINCNICKGVSQEVMDLISYKEIDYETEGEPIGPTYSNETNTFMISNATTILYLSEYLLIEEKNKEVKDLLSLIQLKHKK